MVDIIFSRRSSNDKISVERKHHSEKIKAAVNQVINQSINMSSTTGNGGDNVVTLTPGEEGILGKYYI